MRDLMIRTIYISGGIPGGMYPEHPAANHHFVPVNSMTPCPDGMILACALYLD
jgi:hypothetical protein